MSLHNVLTTGVDKGQSLEQELLSLDSMIARYASQGIYDKLDKAKKRKIAIQEELDSLTTAIPQQDFDAAVTSQEQTANQQQNLTGAAVTPNEQLLTTGL